MLSKFCSPLKVLVCITGARQVSDRPFQLAIFPTTVIIHPTIVCINQNTDYIYTFVRAKYTRCEFLVCCTLRKTQDRGHELVVIDLNPPITIGVEPSERLAELFDNDTSADEAVECNAGWGSTILANRRCFDVYISQKDRRDGRGRKKKSPYFF